MYLFEVENFMLQDPSGNTLHNLFKILEGFDDFKEHWRSLNLRERVYLIIKGCTFNLRLIYLILGNRKNI